MCLWLIQVQSSLRPAPPVASSLIAVNQFTVASTGFYLVGYFLDLSLVLLDRMHWQFEVVAEQHARRDPSYGAVRRVTGTLLYFGIGTR
jgi:hypothetical protein